MEFIRTAQEILNIKQTYKHYLDYQKLKEQYMQRVSDDDFDVYIFEQTWGNTSGGFEGMGGSATQTTYVLIPKFDHDCLVFFGGTFAYKAPHTRIFIDDVLAGKVRGKPSSGYYNKTDVTQ